MQSTSYRSTTSVISAGFRSNATLSPSSPLMDPLDPPMSGSYDLYPGFWYTLQTGPMPCEDLFSFAQAFGAIDPDFNYSIACDSEPDGDIDGVDLAVVAERIGAATNAC